MTIQKALSFLPGLLLAGALIGLAGCGSFTSSQPNGKPDSVQILIDELPYPSPAPREKPVVLLTDAALLQQLYTTIYALPQTPALGNCPAVGGPHYTLTFRQRGKTLVTVLADRGGCGTVSIAGESHDRLAADTSAFWSLLDTAIHKATPPATPDRLAIEHAPDPAQAPQTAQIPSAETAQRLYTAILALTWLPQGGTCVDTDIPEYQLAFQTASQTIPAIVHPTCNSIDLEGAYHARGGWYAMTDQFKHLLQQTIAGATFAPARPDLLVFSVTTTWSTTSRQTNVADAQVRQRLYQKAFSLPAVLPPQMPACVGANKVAGKGTRYDFRFSQWSLPLLQISAFEEGSCQYITVSEANQQVQGDQEFWNLVHQASGQH